MKKVLSVILVVIVAAVALYLLRRTPYDYFDSPQARLAFPFAFLAEEIDSIESQMKIVDGVSVYSGEERNVTNEGFAISIDSQGIISITGSITGIDEQMSITRAPIVINGELNWNCNGRPKGIMPRFCRD